MPSPPDLVVSEVPQQAPHRYLHDLWWFMAWMVAGFLYLISILTALDHQGVTSWYIGRLLQLNAGVVLGVAAGLTVVLLLVREALRWAASGLLVGWGLTCLWLAYLNRGGPGLVYRPVSRRLESVIEASDWRIWLLAGLALLAVGAVLGLFNLARHHSSEASTGS